MPQYCHLHNHTQYSLLDGASNIGSMMAKAKADNQSAVALTDHGNMYGAFKFVEEAKKHDIKPILGCEFYLVEDRFKRTFVRSAGESDRRYHQLLLAKNAQGYSNLSKMCSIGFTEGLYQKFPRIDKSVIEKYHEGVIATSCCIGAEIPQAIAYDDLEKAEELLKWWLNIFQDDYYIEIQRHRGLEKLDIKGPNGKKIYSKYSQEDINQILLGFAEKHNVKVIATNDSHYVDEEDSVPHDILLCINTGNRLEDENRFKFSSSDFYFKTQKEMIQLFEKEQHAIDNTMEIVDKVETLDLSRDIILPEFPLPSNFKTQDDYLKYLTYEGAKQRYGTVSPAIEERLNFELSVISSSGYPGYFLIVEDLISAARKMGVVVGPGRGSAAGSAVAYCLGITNIDPIKYDLLFERFLNPERVSMPDIDIDFDDEGRSKVIDYVIDKYGQNQVAQIITYGTMAAKSSLRDVGRVLDIPLHEVDRITKIFPNNLGASLNKVLKTGDIDSKLKDALPSDELNKAYEFRKLADKEDDFGHMIRTAKKLEGNIRNTGIHACGIIITPDDITNYIPVRTNKDSDLLVSQFDNSVVEKSGLLKMDFLGLRNLSVIKTAVQMVNERHNLDLDIETIPLDDVKTFELFQRGDTIGIFQFESGGMASSLKQLKPTQIEDLIAMNALYRPGPMEYIKNFTARKHGKEPIEYDLPEMEEHLKETYGITVYQEQVMLLSQKLGGFTKGEADILRKAMGKKKKKLIDELYPKFLEGCEKNGHPKEKIEKIWKDWEKFASYAFNKSHATCYTYIAWQTAYLKTHYPAEYMSALLNHNKQNVKSLNVYLTECAYMGLKVLGPSVNESFEEFKVNENGDIRFGLSGLKGVGTGPVEELVIARNEGVTFNSIFDLTKVINLRVLNKRVLDSLAYSGAFDEFGLTRAQYFAPSEKYETLIEHAIKYGQAYQSEKERSQNSLFGDLSDVMLTEPVIKPISEWSVIEKLTFEKEVTGMYISGHPLDDYKFELSHFVNCSLDIIDEVIDKVVSLAGIVTEANHGISRNKGTGYCRFTIQDMHGSFSLGVYREDYQKYKDLLSPGQVIYIEGINQKNQKNDNLFFKVRDLRMLETVGRDLTKKITLKADLESIKNDSVSAFIDLLKKHSGEVKLNFQIVDEEVDLKFHSKTTMIQMDKELIRFFNDQGWHYKLN